MWDKGISSFPWSYGEAETCYLIAGCVEVTPEGGEPVVIGKGDLATFATACPAPGRSPSRLPSITTLDKTMIPADIKELAQELADISGGLIRSYYRTAFAIDDKSDASPVTAADREAEALMRKRIRERRPQDGIIGEEFGRENEEAEWVWVLDPVDGT